MRGLDDLEDGDMEALFGSESEDLSDAYALVRWFQASYDSECAECGGDITEGDRAGYIDNDDKASCEDCCDAALHG